MKKDQSRTPLSERLEVALDKVWKYTNQFDEAQAGMEECREIVRLIASSETRRAVDPTVEDEQERAAAPRRWRDTKVTVPCDGENVLGVWGVGSTPSKVDISVVHYYSGRWHEPDDDEDDYRAPDFWMKLPEAPK